MGVLVPDSNCPVVGEVALPLKVKVDPLPMFIGMVKVNVLVTGTFGLRLVRLQVTCVEIKLHSGAPNPDSVVPTGTLLPVTIKLFKIPVLKLVTVSVTVT